MVTVTPRPAPSWETAITVAAERARSGLSGAARAAFPRSDTTDSAARPILFCDGKKGRNKGPRPR